MDQPESTPSPSPVQTESAVPETNTLAQSLDKALVEFPIPEEGSAPKAPQTEPPEQAAPGQGKAAEEPDHLKWVKSQSGFVDPATGQVNLDAVAKQAFELNRAYQTQAQNINQLGTLLRHPKIAAAFAEVTGGMQQQPQAGAQAETEPSEKSEQEILAEFVRSEINAVLAPVQQQASIAYRNFEASQVALAYQQLRNEFGTTKMDGKDIAVYDTIAPQVDQQILAEAASVGATVPAYISYLIQNNLLYPKFSNAAKAVLFPSLQQKTAQAQTTATQTSLEKQKRTALTGKSSSPQVRSGAKKITSFAEAAAAAEEELASKQ
jgi:hypothetical protein